MSADEGILNGLKRQRTKSIFTDLSPGQKIFICHFIESLQHLEMSHNIIIIQKRKLRC